MLNSSESKKMTG